MAAEILEEFDETFGRMPEKSLDMDLSLSEGQKAGCDDCVHNQKIRKRHKMFLLSAMKEAASMMVVEEKSLDHRRFMILPKEEAQIRAWNAARQDQLERYKTFFGEECGS